LNTRRPPESPTPMYPLEDAGKLLASISTSIELDAFTYLRRASGLAASSISFFVALSFCRATFRRAWLFFFRESPVLALRPPVLDPIGRSPGGAVSSRGVGSWGGSWGGMMGDGEGDGGRDEREDRGEGAHTDDR